jgi:hypothetical protein
MHPLRQATDEIVTAVNVCLCDSPIRLAATPFCGRCWTPQFATNLAHPSAPGGHSEASASGGEPFDSAMGDLATDPAVAAPPFAADPTVPTAGESVHTPADPQAG